MKLKHKQQTARCQLVSLLTNTTWFSLILFTSAGIQTETLPKNQSFILYCIGFVSSFRPNKKSHTDFMLTLLQLADLILLDLFWLYPRRTHNQKVTLRLKSVQKWMKWKPGQFQIHWENSQKSTLEIDYSSDSWSHFEIGFKWKWVNSVQTGFNSWQNLLCGTL